MFRLRYFSAEAQVQRDARNVTTHINRMVSGEENREAQTEVLLVQFAGRVASRRPDLIARATPEGADAPNLYHLLAIARGSGEVAVAGAVPRQGAPGFAPEMSDAA